LVVLLVTLILFNSDVTIFANEIPDSSSNYSNIVCDELLDR